MFQREFWESGSVGEGVLLGMRMVIQSNLRIQPGYEGYAARWVGIRTIDNEHRLVIQANP